MLPDVSLPPTEAVPAPEAENDLAANIEHTDWGPSRRPQFPLQIEGIDAFWDHPARNLGTAPPEWLSDSA